MATESWFRTDPSKGAVTFLNHPDRAWTPNVLSDVPFPVSALPRERVILEGKAPTWMYAHVCALAVAAGVRRVEVRQPQEEAPIVVHPASPDVAPQPWSACSEGADTGLLVRFLEPDVGERWSSVTARALWLPSSDGSVCLTGRAANWMYAAAAARAVEGGAELVTVFNPREGMAIVVHGKNPGMKLAPGAELEAPGPGGIVIGVVGDPNSGKSVLGHLLDQARRRAGIEGWLLDADGASPTPNWYLRMQEQERVNAERGAELRQQQKLDWTPAMEDKLAADLRHLRASQPLVIADLPGGKHPKPHHDWPAERIPAHREVMMVEVDAFVVLSRADPESGDLAIAEKWEEELASHGLEDRICAVFVSRDPAQPLRCEVRREGERFAGELTGLDRGHVRHADDATLDALADMLTWLVEKHRASRSSEEG